MSRGGLDGLAINRHRHHLPAGLFFPLPFPAEIYRPVICQILSDFQFQFLQEFGVGSAQFRGFLGGGLLPVPESGQTIPVILAEGLEGRTFLEETPQGGPIVRKPSQNR